MGEPILLLTQQNREAARIIFSHLTALEQIGVDNGGRGVGVPGQLEDEIVHQNAFYELSCQLGGYHPPDDSTWDLIHFLRRQPDDIAFTLLNSIGEVWFECLFGTLASVYPYSELLHSVAADEARHTATPPAARGEAVREAIEELHNILGGMVRNSRFAAAMQWVLGPRKLVNLMSDVLRVHRQALQKLECGDVPGIRRISAILCGARASLHEWPEEMLLTPWDRSRFKMFGVHNTIWGDIEVSCRSRQKAQVEAMVVRSLGRALEVLPECNVSIRQEYPRVGKLYKPVSPMVLVRRRHTSGAVVSIPIKKAGRRSTRWIKHKVVGRHRKFNEQPFTEMPDLWGITDLLPPSKSSWSVSFTGANSGGTYGSGQSALVQAEGLAGSVTIGPLVDGKVQLGFNANHAAIEGYDLVKLMDVVGREMNAAD